MNICIVGYGAIAGHHMQAFAAIDGVKPYYLVGRRPEPTAQFAQTWGFARHTLDLDEALADENVDAVVITSPNDLHVPQATKTLAAGKHLLLEIPIAMNLAESQAVAALAARSPATVMMCHTMRFMPAMQEVRRRVAAGELDLHHIIGLFGILRRTNTTMYGKPRSWTDNILWHHAAHFVDAALWIAGRTSAQNVHCVFGPPHPTQNTMDMNLSMSLPGGVLVNLCESYNIAHFRWRAIFIGKQTTLEFREGELIDLEGNVVVPRTSIVDLSNQNRQFVAAVREARRPACTPEDVLPCMQVLQKAQDSVITAGR